MKLGKGTALWLAAFLNHRDSETQRHREGGPGYVGPKKEGQGTLGAAVPNKELFSFFLLNFPLFFYLRASVVI